jgi:hypothetical protein
LVRFASFRHGRVVRAQTDVGVNSQMTHGSSRPGEAGQRDIRGSP